MKQIILASASPRRRELLAQIGYAFEVRTSGAEEITTAKGPSEICKELAYIKAQAVWKELREEEREAALVIGADTIVWAGEEMLGKPRDEADAARMLRLLSGGVHQVYTGVAILSCEEQRNFSVCTNVQVEQLSEQEIADYIATKDPMDKAGAYGIQGMFARHVTGIEGDYNNVVGLPVAALYRELKKMC